MTFGARRDGANSKEYYLASGKRGEKAAESLLAHIFPRDTIRDVRESPDYQLRDIDYLVNFKNAVKFVEVKFDKHLPRGNFCFEVMRIRHNSQWDNALYLGWTVRTDAHVLLMFSPNEQSIYVVYHHAIVSGLQRSVQSPTPPRVGFVPTDPQRTTLNIYIPQSDIPHSKYKWDGLAWDKE